MYPLFRLYADRYHHYKEEEILFPEMSRKNEMIASGVIHEMLENHAAFREMPATIEQKIEQSDLSGSHSKMLEYTSALINHIAAENDEVFQMTETLFDERELENIQFCFIDCYLEFGNKENKSFEDWPYANRSRLTIEE